MVEAADARALSTRWPPGAIHWPPWSRLAPGSRSPVRPSALLTRFPARP